MTDQKYKDLMNGGWSYPKKESTDPEEVKKVVDKYLTDNKIDSETIDKKITDGVSKIVADAPEDFDTLKEMSDWISEHEDSAAAMNSAILDNKSGIETLQKDKANATDVETLKTEVNNNTNAISEVNDSLSALGKCKNLLKTTLGSGNVNGITYINNGNGTYTLSGTCTNTFELHFNPSLKLPYGKYKLLGTSAYQKTNNGEWRATLGSGDVFEVSESKPMLDVLAYISSDSVVNETFKPMVTTNLNATADDFVPYTGDEDTLTADVAKVKNDMTWKRVARVTTTSTDDIISVLPNTWKEVMVDIEDTTTNTTDNCYARSVFTIYRECVTYNGNNYFRTGYANLVVNITGNHSIKIPEMNSGTAVTIYYRN